jgi:signal transduction histidine kinase
LAAFAIGICSAMVEARRRREKTEDLLGELEAVHAELERYAERGKELTVSGERARMSREMHDSLGHYLTVINVGLQNAQRFREKRPESAWAEVEEARDLTREALSEVRRWVRVLKPRSPSKIGPHPRPRPRWPAHSRVRTSMCDSRSKASKESSRAKRSWSSTAPFRKA